MATWVSDAVVKRRIAAVQGVGNPDDLPSHQDVAVEDGNVRGYEWIRGRLIGRGYTAAQLETWAARDIWNKDAAVYFALETLCLDDDRASNVRRDLYERLFGKDGIDALTLLDASGNVIEVGTGAAGANVTYGDVYVDEDDGTIHTGTTL